MSYKPTNQIKVSLKFTDKPIPVGRLAFREGIIYFEYDSAFLSKGLEISPIKCPLKAGVQTFDRFLFEGLPGVFNDSLPDGWGRLLVDRSMRMHGILPSQLNPLDRLAHVGFNRIGALVYEPGYHHEMVDDVIKLDQLALHAKQVLESDSEDVLEELLALNGSSAGARPKAMIGVDKSKKTIIHGVNKLSKDFEPWLVKFPNMNDGIDVGAIEYVYALIAKEAGLEITEVHLFPSKRGPGYFATKRFDRCNQKRIHTHSICGLLHSDFRIPSLDYEDLIALTMVLTKNIKEAEKMFRISVFNVLAHNRDDHSKNFSFLMDENGQWRLSPAYDLTFSYGPNGEQSTTVMGEGKNPKIDHLIKLGLEAKLQRSIIDECIEKTKSALRNWRKLSSMYEVAKSNIELIAQKIDESCK